MNGEIEEQEKLAYMKRGIEKYGEENEIEQYLYNKERGEIVSIVDDFCVCIYAGKEQPMNDFEYLKSCFRFESISFDS